MSSLTVTVIQTDLFWEEKSANLEMLYNKITGLQKKTELVILPEMFSTGFSMNTVKLAEKMDGETIAWMRNLATEQKIIITGSIIIEEEGKFYNRSIWMLPSGQLGFYDKRHLFAFGDEHNHYTPGHKRLIACAKGWKINLQVCYDLRFPVWIRQSNFSSTSKTKDGEYDLLIFVANWPEKRSLAWKTLLQARAIENQCYVIGVNRVGEDGNHIKYAGDSMIIDPQGEVLYQKTNAEDIYTCSLSLDKVAKTRHDFPFLSDADSFIINS